ncbi:MAG TPA: hypothetical protein VGN00_01495 [Puia sp.]
MNHVRSLQSIQEAGTAAVRRLCEEKLNNGQPFMINAEFLPVGQCYLEFPMA